MPIWLLALAYVSSNGTRLLPRRLIWVVNRRVVVDQATDEAAKMVGRLETPELAEVRASLLRLHSGTAGQPLGISTLRGQFADNAEWRYDPARPAVITGTVDMIGSRLLFSGYGCGFKSRPLHAGLLGQDALLVHDEAHLEPAFQSLIQSIQVEQKRAGDIRPLRTMQLTATARVRMSGFTLTEKDMAEGEIGVRVKARKGISFLAITSPKELASTVATHALAFQDAGVAVLVFVRRLADVDSIVRTLHKVSSAVQPLTGTMRGTERDELLQNSDILARFLHGSSVEPRKGTVYLVSTSAGEVGVDLSADHSVCDLTPFDSMTQRLGRVNRFGKGDSKVEVVHYPPQEKATAFDEACERTLMLLRDLPVRKDGRFDASPAALNALDEEKRAAAFSPRPEILPTSDILFDRWALTSIRGAMPGRPPVADWLHGVEEGEASQTHVAWRDEVQILGTNALRAEYELAELLDDYPLKPHELLRDSSLRVVEQIEKIAKRTPDASFWIVAADDGVSVATFAEFVTDGDRRKLALRIGSCTLLLPPTAGGLNEGFLEGDSPFSQERQYDVSDRWLDEKQTPRRVRLWDDEAPPRGMRLVRRLDLQVPGEDDEEPAANRRYWNWYVRPQAADDDGSMSAKRPQELIWHCERAEAYAIRLAAALQLNPEETEALRLAAVWHDRGKDRDVWQRSIGNREYPRLVLAKSGGNTAITQWSGYRHEFGSLLEMGDASDLARHIVAAHHGRARPHFPDDEAFDPKYSEAIAGAAAVAVPVRFVRLQGKYGRWGLAYLESLLRVVDAWASREEMAKEAEA